VVTFDEDDRMSEVSEQEQNHQVEPEQVVPQDDVNTQEPTDRDVVYGRGPHIYDRPGNIWLREDHLPRYRVRYNSGAKENKRRIAQEALDALTAAGRRMLKRIGANGSGGWVVASNEDNIQKIMDDLRHSRRSSASANGLLGTHPV
jgi:hypothetical protein